MSIRLRQLRAFKAIVDHGSVSDAAVALSLTQSSVSKSLAGFEAEIGFQLFDRIGRRLSLSEQGRAFLARAGNAMELLEAIEADAADIRDNLTTRFRVTAIGPVLMSAFLPRVLARFSLDYPNLRLSVETKARTEIEDWVANGHADIGITLLPVQRGQLRMREIARVSAVTILPVDHPLANRSQLSPNDLADERMVMPRQTVRLRSLVEASFIQAGVQLSTWIETSNAVSTANLVAEGNGIAVVDPFTVTGLAREKVAIVPWAPDIVLSYGMIWPGNNTLAAHERKVVELSENVVREMAAESPWFRIS